MLGLDDHQQAFFVGIRSTFYRIAMISGQGLLVIIAGVLEHEGFLGFGGNIVAAWSITFGVVGGLFLVVAAYHAFILPRPASDVSVGSSTARGFGRESLNTFASFFRRDGIGLILAFLLLYRFGEAQLVKMVSPFLLDGIDKGGLGLSTEQVGFVYGTMGIIALTLGGLTGGFAVARHGLRYWLWPMVLIIHVPDAVFVYLSAVQPSSLWLITGAVALEQFGYGFGFTAYMMYMIYVSRGQHSTAHYAICTGFMALGMMLPGMASGWVQMQIGYVNFFLWVLLATIPSFFVARMVTIDPDFGKKKAA
jgi:PAT family beta-lactamase induction signal transducer AmpG